MIRRRFLSLLMILVWTVTGIFACGTAVCRGAVSTGESPAELAQQLRCSRCGDGIRGNYYEARGKNYCASCYMQYIVPRCGSCGVPIDGKYYTDSKTAKNYCAHCYTTKIVPKCKTCKTPLTGRYYTNDKKEMYCASCHRAMLPSCDSCGKKMDGKYIQNKHFNKKFCTQCKHKYQACSYCATPVGPNPRYPQDDFPLCRDCTKTAVVSGKELKELYRMARRYALSSVGIEAPLPVNNILFSSHQQLAARAKKMNISPEGGKLNGLYAYENGNSFIYIQKGMPETLTFDTLCHEYAHAWDTAYGKRGKELILKEGFAEWVSYKCLLNAGYGSLAEMKKENPDKIYGNGLRKVLALEKRIGIQGVLDYMKKNTSI